MTPLDWMMAGDTGGSSETIMHVMEQTPPPRAGPDIPYDLGDFGRCHRLLLTFHAYRDRLPEVASAYPAWAGFVREWAHLTSLFEADDDAGLTSAMKRLVEEARVDGGWERTAFGWEKGEDVVFELGGGPSPDAESPSL